MRAALCTAYGPPEHVHVGEVPDPIPGPGEVLVRVSVAPLNSGDSRVRSLRVPRGMATAMRLAVGWSRPRQPILGAEFAGAVAALGPGSGRFKVGDRIFGGTVGQAGGHAELVRIPENGVIAPIPEGISDEEAAAVLFGGSTALYFLRKGRLGPGDHILINGASGAVGTLSIQMARHMGAVVTAVCSAANADLVTALGADRVIDYTRTDFTETGPYDLVMDCAGNAPWKRSRRALKPGGRFLLVAGEVPDMVRAAFNKAIVGGVAFPKAADIEELGRLAKTGAIRAVIDRRYPLEEIVEAYRYVDAGHKKGSVLILPVAAAH